MQPLPKNSLYSTSHINTLYQEQSLIGGCAKTITTRNTGLYKNIYLNKSCNENSTTNKDKYDILQSKAKPLIPVIQVNSHYCQFIQWTVTNARMPDPPKYCQYGNPINRSINQLMPDSTMNDHLCQTLQWTITNKNLYIEQPLM